MKFKNCPICSSPFKFKNSSPYKEARCVSQPNHFFTALLNNNTTIQITFSVSHNYDTYIVQNFVDNKSTIYFHSNPVELNYIFPVDFPNLTYVKKLVASFSILI